MMLDPLAYIWVPYNERCEKKWGLKWYIPYVSYYMLYKHIKDKIKNKK